MEWALDGPVVPGANESEVVGGERGLDVHPDELVVVVRDLVFVEVGSFGYHLNPSLLTSLTLL